ncbi:hypothetical protein CGCS363_v004281 [Colletotrichum siamense]|uniref:uncharacterized protein n=1 Tax=Colletotrichum siamense TaxID=690259 RepID=UPI0018727A95|nr:uncharacterized protein CGCS363_v004281 [Colletotrichum siamense]KAF5505096.1 hypothetical protein CGCS363_v004281 [Colletotrichum siamense]
MFGLKTTSVALFALFSTVSLAVPTSSDAGVLSARQIDTSDWVPFEFQGKTLKVNPAALNITKAPGEVSVKVITNDCCGGSSFVGTGAPYPNVGDCAVIRDWAYTLNQYWSIWTNTPDYHGVVVYGTCVFGAGTRNTYDTYIGSSDIGDLVRDAINGHSSNGVVNCAGDMGCENQCTQSGCPFSGRSAVFWKMQHN